MTLYEKTKKIGLDLRPLGLEPGPARSDYFCTPVGAKALYWTGVDGVHYCSIRGFDGMVFAVSPMNGPGDYVHPVAESFEDFLRLVLTCGGEAAVEQTWMWNRGEFDAFMESYPPGPEQRQAMDALSGALALAPMEDPFSYIKALQERFDYRRLRFRKDYYELLPPEPPEPAPLEWKVYYHGGFFSHEGRERAGKETPVGTDFTWAGIRWHVPAVYSCTSGLVLDLCGEIDPTRVAPSAPDEIEDPEERERLDALDPLNFDLRARGELNGAAMEAREGFGLRWTPPSPGEKPDRESRRVLEHYGYDLEKAWIIDRICFPWPGKPKPKLDSLKLKLSRMPVAAPGGRFKAPGVGGSVTLRNRVTGGEHTLTVVELAQEKLDMSVFPDDGMEYPTCYTRMAYRVTPELSGRDFTLQDCAQGDPARPGAGAERAGLPCAAAIGIIGGADGPTTLTLGAPAAPGTLHMAASSLHFEPVEDVQWRITFWDRPNEEFTVQVI